MCWNLEVSLLTGLTTQIIALYLWKRNIKCDRWYSIFLSCFGLIQFAEAIIWFGQKYNLNDLSMLSVKYFIPLILACEPLAALYGAIYFGHKVTRLEKLAYVIFATVLLVAGHFRSPAGKPLITEDGISYGTCNSQGICNPGIYSSLVFWLFCAYPTFKYLQTPRFVSHICNIAGFCTLILAFLTRPTAGGSYWCLYSTGMSFLYLFTPYLY
jgi:hypothetical protein